MNVGWTPGIRMVLPGIRTWTNGQKAIDTIFIRQTAANAEEIRIEWPRPLIPLVKVATSGIGLPDFQERVRYGIPTVVEHAAGHNDALADCLAAGPGVAREVGVFRTNSADNRTRSCQFREGQRHVDERKRWGTASRGLICLVQVRWKDLPIPSHNFPNRDVLHTSSSWLTR